MKGMMKGITENEARRAMLPFEPPLIGILTDLCTKVASNNRDIRNFVWKRVKIFGCTAHLLWFRPKENGAIERCAPLKFFNLEHTLSVFPGKPMPAILNKKQLKNHPFLKPYAGKEANIVGMISHRPVFYMFYTTGSDLGMLGPGEWFELLA